MKHVEIDLHFIRDKIAAKEIAVCYVLSYEQNVDCLCKALASSRFVFLRDKLGVTKSPTSLRGAVNIVP